MKKEEKEKFLPLNEGEEQCEAKKPYQRNDSISIRLLTADGPSKKQRKEQLKAAIELNRKQSHLRSWLILAFVVILVCIGVLWVYVSQDVRVQRIRKCSGLNHFALVESIPIGVDLKWPLNDPNMLENYFHSTGDAWIDLIGRSLHTIDIVCFYMTLNDTADIEVVNHTSDQEKLRNGHVIGIEVYKALIEAAKRGVDIRIVTSAPGITTTLPPPDAARLEKQGYAHVRTLNMTRLEGSGVVHSKFMVIDEEQFYIGSANMDWRSLTQVKELGIVVHSECLSQDLMHQFEEYWQIAHTNELPTYDDEDDWPFQYWAIFNASNPANVEFTNRQLDSDDVEEKKNDVEEKKDNVEEKKDHHSMVHTRDQDTSHVYMTASPSWFCPTYRSVDINAITTIISNAREFVSVSVMDYTPTTLYTTPLYYFPEIDTALRAAAFNHGVQVNLLISIWEHSKFHYFQYLKSLNDLQGVNVYFIYLPQQKDIQPIPFTRVNHCKYLLTERTALITTSNWSGDYFINTLGASFVTDDATVVQQMNAVFSRDISSQYAFPYENLPDWIEEHLPSLNISSLPI